MTPMLFRSWWRKNIKLCLLIVWVLERTENLMDDVIFSEASSLFCFTISAKSFKMYRRIHLQLTALISSFHEHRSLALHLLKASLNQLYLFCLCQLCRLKKKKKYKVHNSHWFYLAELRRFFFSSLKCIHFFHFISFRFRLKTNLNHYYYTTTHAYTLTYAYKWMVYMWTLNYIGFISRKRETKKKRAKIKKISVVQQLLTKPIIFHIYNICDEICPTIALNSNQVSSLTMVFNGLLLLDCSVWYSLSLWFISSKGLLNVKNV